MSDQEPTWTQDDGCLKTDHAGCHCVVGQASGTGRWYWTSYPKLTAGVYHGYAGSLWLAKTCSLRTAEAAAVLEACKKGDPPERSGFPQQFSTTDTSLPTPVGVHTSDQEGGLGVSLWVANESDEQVVVGLFKPVTLSRDDFLRQIGEHIVHLGKYGWTSTDPEQRKELRGAHVADSGAAATEEDDRG